MKSAYMIHEVVLNGNRLSPNSIALDLSDETFAELEALGAAREATDDEVLLASPAIEPLAVDPKVAAKAEKAAAKKAKEEAEAAAKAAEEAAAAAKDGDPDVTDNADLLGEK